MHTRVHYITATIAVDDVIAARGSESGATRARARVPPPPHAIDDDRTIEENP